jgi:S-adenosylmethionine:tRNA ribosyltransferase-isomerase
MDVADFDFDLPPDRIAQEPASPRDASRLMVMDRATGGVTHHRFAELAGELTAGDLLVLNDTKVIPARLLGTKPTGGGIEVLLLEPAGAPDEWRALIAGGKSVRPGVPLTLRAGLRAVPVSREDEVWRVRLVHDHATVAGALEAAGEVPLPPYIRRSPDDLRGAFDRDRYQTIFARAPGAVAAPTAGLHFTPTLLATLAAKGIETTFVTLHVGLGTFAPIRVTDVQAHRMHEEPFTIPASTADAIARARKRGGRVVAVGTTVARTLETSPAGSGGVRPGTGRSSLFIYPGYRFQVVDALVTNFHLPRSTLLMLVCAFAGTSHVLSAYQAAIDAGYRFYSYGDAMFVRPA